MIGYMTLGSNDLDKASAFYDALLGELNARRVMENERMIVWSAGRGKTMLAVCKPHDEQSATAGNGTMIAFDVGSKDQVHHIHARALELGATDEGEPGERMQGFYGAYFRDLDGNKFVAFTMG